MAFGEVMMPMTEHSAEILAGAWPSQSVMAWSGYAMQFSQAANNLFKELDVQMDIKQILAPMEGAFIDAARGLEAGRETALQNRIEAYRHISRKAHWAANELQSTKSDLVEIVNSAEEKIQTSRENAEKAKTVAAQTNPLTAPAAIAAIEAQLEAAIAGIISAAKAEAHARDMQGAGTVAALSTDIAQWAEPFVNHILSQSGGMPGLTGGGLPAAPPGVPAPQDTPGNVKPVDYSGTGDSLRQAAGTENAQQNTANDPKNDPDRTIQQTAFKQPDKIDPHEASKPSTSASPPSTSAPSPSSGGSSSNPASVLGQMMKPASSGSSSPASSSPASSSAATNPATAAQSSQLANASGANATGGANAAGAAGRAPGLASLGSGLAESSARMASGAVNSATNAVSAATNVGTNIAQNVAQAAAQVPAATPAATTTPASVGAPVGGTPPMTVVPPPAAAVGGVGPVSPVTGAPPAAAPPTPAPAGPISSSSVVPASAGSAGASLAPVAMPGSSIRGIGADGASGDLIFDQAMEAGRDVITALVAQTLGTGYIDIHYAVSLIWERGGTISAWMATSEGASYIPLGVRIPQEVRLSVTDPIVGHELWNASAEAGGADPLEIVVRQAEAREQAAPGARVLALASSLPMGHVIDWAGAVSARPVSVNPREVERSSGIDLSMLHRCAVAMPWEWRQANAFTEQDRLKVAARHMYMAATAGHLGGGACEHVIELFEERKPIDEALWAEVAKQRFMALIEYQTSMSNAGQGGAEPPARALATARAAEVVLCLRNYDTAEGCADLLYATRLAGAPLNPAAAVA